MVFNVSECQFLSLRCGQDSLRRPVSLFCLWGHSLIFVYLGEGLFARLGLRSVNVGFRVFQVA